MSSQNTPLFYEMAIVLSISYSCIYVSYLGFAYVKKYPDPENFVVFADVILAFYAKENKMRGNVVQDMYKLPIMARNLEHMNFVWNCLDLLVFDTKCGFYRFAAKESDKDNDWIQVSLKFCL